MYYEFDESIGMEKKKLGKNRIIYFEHALVAWKTKNVFVLIFILL